jgi:hypothetical protein
MFVGYFSAAILLFVTTNNVHGRTCNCEPELLCALQNGDDLCTDSKDCNRPCRDTWEVQEHVYTIKTNGGCSEPVDNEAECLQASSQLNTRRPQLNPQWPSVDDTPSAEIQTVNYATAPFGCYLYSGGSGSPVLRFNTNEDAEDNCKSNQVCVCKTTCDEREYQNDIDQESCKTCEAGEYSIVGQKTCNMNAFNCPTGTLGTNGYEVCRGCPAGYYSDEINRHECSIIANECTVDQECKQCSLGRYTSKSKRSREADCLQCAKGKYSDTMSATSCTKCPKAKYSDQYGASPFYFIILICTVYAPGFLFLVFSLFCGSSSHTLFVFFSFCTWYLVTSEIFLLLMFFLSRFYSFVYYSF